MRNALLIVSSLFGLAGCDKKFNYDYCRTHPGQYPQYCGLDGGTIDGPIADAPPGYYTIGGSVTGLQAAGLMLLDNGGDALQIAGDGQFTFPTALIDGAMYTVTVGQQPTGEVCNVSNAGGMIMSANITDVSVSCQFTSDVIITCGANSCTVGTQECCHDAADALGVCQTSGTGCPTGKGPQFCDDNTDCGGGTNVCCAHIGKAGNFQTAVCDTSAAACVPVSMGSVVILCDPTLATPCPGTMMCVASATRGWNQCQ
jgi:hypothetical protein